MAFTFQMWADKLKINHFQPCQCQRNLEGKDDNHVNLSFCNTQRFSWLAAYLPSIFLDRNLPTIFHSCANKICTLACLHGEGILCADRTRHHSHWHMGPICQWERFYMLDAYENFSLKLCDICACFLVL